VAIDIIGNSSADYGVLRVYTTGNSLLATLPSGKLTSGQVFSAVYNSGTYNIDYIIAGASTTQSVHLDNLSWNVDGSDGVIPEPSTVIIWTLLATLGLGVISRRRRRK